MQNQHPSGNPSGGTDHFQSGMCESMSSILPNFNTGAANQLPCQIPHPGKPSSQDLEYPQRLL